eukprot:TRINITY_DN264_c0_g1_i1.p1 TRINITY_DN264_c0_g1~~TRINITY_DN264_c0_g1_i1.p1  ORF type:complete len:882 (+),score=266.09 TRINITY_DN264_c0_g1_i1:86-2731(+)
MSLGLNVGVNVNVGGEASSSAPAPAVSKADQDKVWERTQKKTFTAWCNSHLRKVGSQIVEIGKDFEDGLKLAQLLEVIADDKVEKINKNPKMRIQNIQNLGQCLNFIAGKGVKLAGIGAEEIADGNLKMCLGMVWTIILRFQIQDISIEELSAKEGLLLWCQRKTDGYANVKVQNFHQSWQDGLAFCALIHKHRPDLLDFSKLDPADKAGNLQLAFDIAANSLDIPKMLDVNDLLDVARPDERSIMTYVAAYFHVFSASQKAETAAKRVAKLLEFTEANNLAKTDYVEKAQALSDWVNQTIERMEDRNFGNDSESIKKQLEDFKNYKQTEKPPKAKDLTNLEAAFNSLQTKLRLNNRSAFVPPAGLSPADLDALWLRLEKAEQDRADALRSHFKRQRKIDYNLQKYNNKLARFEEWNRNEDSYLKNTEVGTTLSVVNAQLKNMEAFTTESASVGSTFNQDTEEILSKLEAAGYFDMATLRQRKQTLVEGPYTQLGHTSNSRKQKLTEAYDRLSEIDNLLLDFAKRSSALVLWIDSKDDTLTDPIVVESEEAVQKLQAAYDAFLPEFQDKTTEVQQVSQIADKLKSLGSAEDVYSKLSQTALNTRWHNLEGLVAARKEHLSKEADTQKHNEALRVEYAEKAKKYNDYITAASQAIGGITSSGKSIEEQATVANEENTKVQNNTDFDDVAASAQKLDDARVTDNKHTDLTVEVLKLRSDKLKNTAQETTEAIQKQILANQKSEVSAEEIADFRECFDHFDKDKDQRLTHHELNACLKSLGEDLNDQQLASVMSEYGVDGGLKFDQFVAYMVKQIKGSDSADNVKASFRIMAEDKPYITEAQLRAVLPSARVDYLLENMPRYEGEGAVDGSYDYSKFTDDVYAQ